MKTPKEVEELIKGSGNNFHAKVARWLLTNGWHVTVSPYYMDQSQNKAREIDLIAEKEIPIKDFFNRPKGSVVAKLFIECKFVAVPAVFWFAAKNMNAAQELVYSKHPFRKDNFHSDKHHYLATSPQVAKLFTSASNKNSENEPFYKALNQALNALVSMRGQRTSIPKLKYSTGYPNCILEFPVVVCSSFESIYAVDFYSESTPKRVVDNFQLEVSYAFVDGSGALRNEYFLLDFVELSQIEDLTKKIEEDLNVAAFFLGES